ncbi:leucine-rich repeat-containing protein 74A [Amia ocellicauda]|uniref:leucine-rich repeat-containing protein 74A n=1 Tax=Amia ocellicauda TaxID=2972642 RepID=UPI0034646831
MSHTSLSVEALCLESGHCARGEEPGSGEEWDTDLEEDEVAESSGVSARDLYLQACQLVGVVPVSYFLRNLGCNSNLNLNHHGLGPRGAKALAIALVSDVTITTLELEDNGLQAEGVKYLVEMLKANCTIQNLNLSNNHLQSAGADYISRMLLDNISLRSLKLSGNEFREEDAKSLSDAFSSNYRVRELDLSHNEFMEKGGEHLGQMLANNEGLEALNLSWNRLRMKGAVALCAGLKVNITLKVLDLSWNGFGNEGALALGEALKFNNTLLHLDLSSNRITNEGAGMLCKGLEANDTLKVLRLAYNSLTVEGALALLTVVKNTARSALEEINISNVLVNETFLQLLEVTCQQHQGLEVLYGGVGGFIAKKPPQRPDPMKVIQDYLDERKLRLWDFFRKIDKDGSMRVPVSEFRKAVQQSSIPLDRFQIEELVQRLDKDRTGKVDYRGLADTRKQMMRDHRRQLRKVESRQKKEKQKSERILKTFQSAVEAVTPRSSMVISPGGAKDESGGPRHFSATPLSSWHHVVMSNSSRFSVSNLSSDHVHVTPTGAQPTPLSASSPEAHSYSQPNLLSEARGSPPVKAVSAQGLHSTSNPEVCSCNLSSGSNSLTRSRPALTPPKRQASKNPKKKSSK